MDMDPAFIVTFWFTVGMALNILPKLRTLNDIKLFFAVIIGSFLISLVPGKHEDVYDLHYHLKLFFVTAMGATFVVLRDRIIPRVNEQVLVINTVILGYALVFMIPRSIGIPLGFLCMYPTMMVVLSIMTRQELDPNIQIFLYFWNDIIFLILLAVQYAAFMDSIPTFEAAAFLPPWQIVTSGMMFATVALPIMGLAYLIPVTAKHQSLEDRLKQIREYLEKVVSNFTEENTTPAKVIFIAVLTWGALTLNRIHPIFSDFTIISLLIIGIPIVFPTSEKDLPKPRIISMVETDR